MNDGGVEKKHKFLWDPCGKKGRVFWSTLGGSCLRRSNGGSIFLVTGVHLLESHVSELKHCLRLFLTLEIGLNPLNPPPVPEPLISSFPY